MEKQLETSTLQNLNSIKTYFDLKTAVEIVVYDKINVTIAAKEHTDVNIKIKFEIPENVTLQFDNAADGNEVKSIQIKRDSIIKTILDGDDNIVVTLDTEEIKLKTTDDQNYLLNFYLFIIINCFNSTNISLDEEDIKHFKRFENIEISPINFDLLELYGLVYQYTENKKTKSNIKSDKITYEFNKDNIPKYNEITNDYDDWNCNFFGKKSGSMFCNQIKEDYNRSIVLSERECDGLPTSHTLCTNDKELITLEKLYKLVHSDSDAEKNLRHFIFSCHQGVFTKAFGNIQTAIFKLQNKTKYIKAYNNDYIFSSIQENTLRDDYLYILDGLYIGNWHPIWTKLFTEYLIKLEIIKTYNLTQKYCSFKINYHYDCVPFLIDYSTGKINTEVLYYVVKKLNKNSFTHLFLQEYYKDIKELKKDLIIENTDDNYEKHHQLHEFIYDMLNMFPDTVLTKYNTETISFNMFDIVDTVLDEFLKKDTDYIGDFINDAGVSTEVIRSAHTILQYKLSDDKKLTIRINGDTYTAQQLKTISGTTIDDYYLPMYAALTKYHNRSKPDIYTQLIEVLQKLTYGMTPLQPIDLEGLKTRLAYAVKPGSTSKGSGSGLVPGLVPGLGSGSGSSTTSIVPGSGSVLVKGPGSVATSLRRSGSLDYGGRSTTSKGSSRSLGSRSPPSELGRSASELGTSFYRRRGRSPSSEFELELGRSASTTHGFSSARRSSSVGISEDPSNVLLAKGVENKDVKPKEKEISVTAILKAVKIPDYTNTQNFPEVGDYVIKNQTMSITPGLFGVEFAKFKAKKIKEGFALSTKAQVIEDKLKTISTTFGENCIGIVTKIEEGYIVTVDNLFKYDPLKKKIIKNVTSYDLDSQLINNVNIIGLQKLDEETVNNIKPLWKVGKPELVAGDYVQYNKKTCNHLKLRTPDKDQQLYTIKSIPTNKVGKITKVEGNNISVTWMNEFKKEDPGTINMDAFTITKQQNINIFCLKKVSDDNQKIMEKSIKA